jgi:hypothetical protein
MKERLITLGCALAALVLFVTLFVQGDTGEGRANVARPTTENQGGNGYLAALRWLGAEHFRVLSMRKRFDELSMNRDLAPTGNVLIVTLPTQTALKTEELRPLGKWLRQGNTLLVLAALSDNPDWAFAWGGIAAGDLNLLTGLEFETVGSRDSRLRGPAGARSRTERLRDVVASASSVAGQFEQPRHSTLVPNGIHAYFSGFREGIALSDYPPQPWTVKVPYDGFVLCLAHQAETGEGVLWTRPWGEGRIVVSGFGSIFTNRAIGLGDNGRLLANLAAANVGARGTVLFDDLHQGLGSAYDPQMFYRDPRLYATMGVLALLWLSWVLGATKLRAPVAPMAARQEADLVRTTGGFLARVVTPAAGARRMFEHFLRQHPWEALERHSRLAATDISQLRSWYADASGSRRVPLVRLHNLLVKIDRQLNS